MVRFLPFVAASQCHMIEYRPLLISIAYSMLGNLAEAEDIVHDVFARWEQMSKEDVRNVRGYLVKATVNSALNYRESAHKQRLVSTNIWLPEPIPDAAVSESLPHGETRSMLTYELMVLMRHLTRDELAVFVLKEAFSYSHKEIGEILEKRPEHSRQLLKRAKGKIGRTTQLSAPITHADLELAQMVVDAISTGDVEALRTLFADDARLMADGGGKVPVSPSPIVGAEKVANLLITAARKAGFIPIFKILSINGQPGLILYRAGLPVGAYVLTPENGKVARMYAMLDPERLQSLSSA